MTDETFSKHSYATYLVLSETYMISKALQIYVHSFFKIKSHKNKYLKRQCRQRFDWVPNSRYVHFAFCPTPLLSRPRGLGVQITSYVYILCISKSDLLKGYHSYNTVRVPTLRVVKYACYKCSLNFIAICGFCPFDFAQCKVLIFLVSISGIVNNIIYEPDRGLSYALFIISLRLSKFIFLLLLPCLYPDLLPFIFSLSIDIFLYSLSRFFPCTSYCFLLFRLLYNMSIDLMYIMFIVNCD